MTTIYKYNLSEHTPQLIVLPKNAVILTCNDQYSDLKLWCLVDTNEPIEQREIIIRDTGESLDPAMLRNYHYVNTIFRGSLVWHVFINRV